MPIPLAIKKYGVPFFSKRVSEYVDRLQLHGFNWEDMNYDDLNEKYHGCQSALRWWSNAWGDESRFNIEHVRCLKEYLLSIKDSIPKISSKCCTVSKKQPLQKYQKSVKCDLVISGERKAEGGQRAAVNKSCYGVRDGIDRFMPLLFWDDETKLYYKETENIVYSDCYEVYGLRRTGCIGCPFALKRKEELEIMKKYEPKLYNACMHIFGKAYDMTDCVVSLRNDKSDKQVKEE